MWQKAHEFVLGVYALTAALPQAGDLRPVAADASCGGVHSGQHCRGIPSSRQSGQGSVHEYSRGLRRGMPLLSDPRQGPWIRQTPKQLSATLEEVSRLLGAYAAAILASGS